MSKTHDQPNRPGNWGGKNLQETRERERGETHSSGAILKAALQGLSAAERDGSRSEPSKGTSPAKENTYRHKSDGSMHPQRANERNKHTDASGHEADQVETVRKRETPMPLQYVARCLTYAHDAKRPRRLEAQRWREATCKKMPHPQRSPK